ncbi:hypothetical protein SAMN06297129_2446 [Pseudooceanicola antarcticus]|uniref:Uncharacterized protein n=1 Tax=Pseudooceanicola antarcticus TaxID=1247613 RepID=A0A285IZ57_9RHOB|nr:hypothetical protein SAMN06297129_2446 [Pseudooceanicola antarcticus]
MSAAGPMPSLGLSLSSGPAISDAQSGGNSVTFAPFFQEQNRSLAQQVLPWAIVGGALWLLMR